MINAIYEALVQEDLKRSLGTAIALAGLGIGGSSAAKMQQPQETKQAETKQSVRVDIDKIWELESSRGKNPNMKKPNSAGALGHFQFVEKTWNEIARKMKKDWDWRTSAVDYDKSAALADYYLNINIPRMLRYFKIPDTIDTRLAAYNWGIGNINKAYKKYQSDWLKAAPEETKNYIKKYHKID